MTSADTPPTEDDPGGLPDDGLDTALRRAWSAPVPRADDGRTVAHYRLLREIGRGGQAVVHLAEDTRLGRRVALKVMNGAVAAHPRALERFVREAQVASRLVSPGIATILDSGFHDGLPWIAMEYVEGITLHTRIREARPAAWTEDVLLIEKLARILHQGHEAGIVHRDIKPGNIMVRPDGDPVVLDFGLACREDGELPTLTATGEHLGTPAYMSPEQIRGHGSRPDRRTDVWSLGIVLYECLTGRRPFEAPTYAALYRTILECDLPRARFLDLAVPREVVTVLEVATEKDPARRYATAAELADDLARVRRREPVRARPPGPILRLRRWSQRHPALAALGITIVLGLVVALHLLSRTRDALAAYELLADGRRLEDLIREAAEDLWPAAPDRLPAMDSWLGRARDLAARRADHQAALSALRARGRREESPPPDAEARELRGLEGEEAEYRNWLAELLPDRPAEAWARWEIRVKARLEGIARLKAEIASRDHGVWRFDDDRDQWRHDLEARFAGALDDFLAPGPAGDTLAGVEARRADAASIERRSLVEPADAWVRAMAGVAEDPRFAGFRLEPEIGLVPLGPDPESGLQEFAHLPTGTPPRRDPATSRLILTEDSAIVLVLVPGGTFSMGAQRDDRDEPGFDPQAEAVAGPVHDVTLDPFFVGKHEMTQGQWVRVTGSNPGRHSELYVPKGGVPHTLLHPVENVTWEEAQRFLRRLSLGLPTEAQWEYACRAGTTTPWWTGPGRESLRGAANIADQAAARWGATWEAVRDWPDLDDGYAPHAPVGSFRANPFGLHDVHGNVWEWCADPSVSYSDHPPRPGDGLRGATEVRDRMATRGGAFHEMARYVRSAHRGKLAPDVRSTGVGVRPARAVGRVAEGRRP